MNILEDMINNPYFIVTLKIYITVTDAVAKYLAFPINMRSIFVR